MSIQNRPSVSVIIPVYNVENYVEKCLNSVINQTLKDIEIIVIDDGSTDSSPAIVDRIAETDSRIKVVHSENCGVSAARNKGLSIANGMYIGFVDSDDYIEPDMYEKMLSVAEKNKCDIVQCGFYSGDLDPNAVECLNPGIYNRHQALLNNVELAGGVVCNKLYSSVSLTGISFDEKCVYSEDRIFNTDVFLGIESMVVIDDILYHYVLRPGSAVHLQLGQKHIDGLRSFDYIIEKADGDQELIKYAAQGKAKDAIYLLTLLIESKEKNRVLIDNLEGQILKLKDLLRDMDYVSFNQRIAFKVFFISRRLFELTVRLRKVIKAD